jgi:hypothetical protein
VVARFGLFLSLLAAQRTQVTARPSPPHFSNVVGIALVLLGAGAIVFAAIQHRAFILSLPVGDLPISHNRAFPVVLALFLGSLGLALAVYLAV